MDPNPLRDHLARLHEELSSLEHVDPTSNSLLVEVQNDVKRLLDQHHAAPAPASAPPPASLPDRLEKIAVQFEADHPTLAASSRRLVDLLGKAGV